MFQQGQADRALRLEEKANKLAQAVAAEKQIDSFNSEWGSIIKDFRTAYALPAGEKQQSAVRETANRAAPILNKALKSGVIGRESYESYLDDIESRMKASREFKTAAPMNILGLTFGGGQPVRVKGDALKKQQQAAQQEFGKMIQEHAGQFDDMDKAFGYLRAGALSKSERVVGTQFLSEKLPKMLNSERYKSLKPMQREQELAKVVNSVLTRYRKRELK